MHAPAWSYLHQMLHLKCKCHLSDRFWSLFLFDSGSPICTLGRLLLRTRYFLCLPSSQFHIQNHFWWSPVDGCILLRCRLFSASFLSLHSGSILSLQFLVLRLPDMQSDFHLPIRHTAVRPDLWPVLFSHHPLYYTDIVYRPPWCRACLSSHNKAFLPVHWLPVHKIYW